MEKAEWQLECSQSPLHSSGQTRPRGPAPSRLYPQECSGATLQVLSQPARSIRPASRAHLPHSASILLISRWFSRQAPGYQDGGAPSRGQCFTISTSELPHPASHVILTTREARGFHSMTISAGPVRCWAPGQLSQTDQLPISRSLRPPGCPGGESIAKWLSDLPRAWSQYQSSCLPSPVLTQVPSSTSQRLLDVDRLDSSFADQSLVHLGAVSFPEHPHLQGKRSNGVSASGSTTARCRVSSQASLGLLPYSLPLPFLMATLNPLPLIQPVYV